MNPDKLTVNGKEYKIIKLLGKGKGVTHIWQQTVRRSIP